MFCKQVTVGLIDSFELGRITRKNCTNFLWNFFISDLVCVITKINKNQKISACYVKHVLFIQKKKESKRGQFITLGLLRLILTKVMVLMLLM